MTHAKTAGFAGPLYRGIIIDLDESQQALRADENWVDLALSVFKDISSKGASHSWFAADMPSSLGVHWSHSKAVAIGFTGNPNVPHRMAVVVEARYDDAVPEGRSRGKGLNTGNHPGGEQERVLEIGTEVKVDALWLRISPDSASWAKVSMGGIRAEASGGIRYEIEPTSKGIQRRLDAQGLPAESPLRGTIQNVSATRRALAYDGDRIVGGIGFTPDGFFKDVHIVQMRVLDQHKGIGTGLLAAIARSIPEGWTMTVTSPVASARPFYEKTGAEGVRNPNSSIMRWSPEAVARLRGRTAKTAADILSPEGMDTLSNDPESMRLYRVETALKQRLFHFPDLPERELQALADKIGSPSMVVHFVDQPGVAAVGFMGGKPALIGMGPGKRDETSLIHEMAHAQRGKQSGHDHGPDFLKHYLKLLRKHCSNPDYAKMLSGNMGGRYAGLNGKTKVYRGVRVWVDAEDSLDFFKRTATSGDWLLQSLMDRKFAADWTGRKSIVEGDGVGVWWSTDLKTAEAYGASSGVQDGDWTFGMVLEAEVEISDEHDDRGREFGYSAEAPVVFAPGDPVQVTGIIASWPEAKPRTRNGEVPRAGRRLSVRRSVVASTTAMPSWRDRGVLPSAECVIAPDLGRSGRNSYLVYLYDQPHARRPTLAEAKATVEDIYGPVDWQRIEGDQDPHHDHVHGWTTMFNDAPYYLLVERLPRLGATAQLGERLWWRVHPEHRGEFLPEMATSAPFFEEGSAKPYAGKPDPGYSAFDSPWHLWLYIWLMWGWDLDAEVVGFTGTRVGTGHDGEDLVMPTPGGTVQRFAIREFLADLLRTPFPASPVFAPWVKGSLNGHARSWEDLAKRLDWLDQGDPVHEHIVKSFAPKAMVAASTPPWAAEFARRWGSVLTDPAQARDRCVEVSEDFARVAREHGLTAEVITGMEFGEMPEFPGFRMMLNGHFAVLLDGQVWDWTARQFDPSAPVPLVVGETQWRARWTKMGAKTVASHPAGGTPVTAAKRTPTVVPAHPDGGRVASALVARSQVDSEHGQDRRTGADRRDRGALPQGDHRRPHVGADRGGRGHHLGGDRGGAASQGSRPGSAGSPVRLTASGQRKVGLAGPLALAFAKYSPEHQREILAAIKAFEMGKVRPDPKERELDGTFSIPVGAKDPGQTPDRLIVIPVEGNKWVACYSVVNHNYGPAQQHVPGWLRSKNAATIFGPHTGARQPLTGGTIYRGLKASLPPDIDAKVRDLLKMETDEDSYARWKPHGGKKVQAGELIVRALEKSHWDSEMGLGRHWSTRREMAVTAAQQGGQGDWSILLTATYAPGDVDPDWDPNAVFMESEDEVRLRPGAKIAVTQVDLLNPNGFFESRGTRVSYQPIRATAYNMRYYAIDWAWQARLDAQAGGSGQHDLTKKRTVPLLERLGRQILADHGHPDTDVEVVRQSLGESEAQYNPDLDSAFLFLDDDMRTKWTLLHEMAHVLDLIETPGLWEDHGDTFKRRFTGLLKRYGNVDVDLNDRPTVAPRHKAPSNLKVRASWSPFQPPAGIKILTGGDAVPGGYNGYFAAYDVASGEKMGYLDYQSAHWDDEDTGKKHYEIKIAMVEIEPKYQRRGIATLLLENLKHDFPIDADTERTIDPGYTTSDGNAWWGRVKGRAAKLATANLRFERLRNRSVEDFGEYRPRDGIDTLVAYDGAQAVGHLSWFSDPDAMVFGAVDALGVAETHQRQGIATALYRRVKEIEPTMDPRASPWITDDGQAWIDSLRLPSFFASRVASALTLPDNGVVADKKTIPMGGGIENPLWVGPGIYEMDISRWSSTRCVALLTEFPGMGVFPIGWLTWDTERHTIEGIFVNEDYRGKGIGVEMKKHAEKAAGYSLDNDSGEYTPEGLAWAKKHGIPKAKNSRPVSASEMGRMRGQMNNLLMGSDDLITRLLLKVG